MTSKSVQKACGYDAVVIGTGLGGSTLAYRLAQRGMHVLILEKGDVLQLRPHQLGEPTGINVNSFPALAAKEMSFPHGLNIVGGQTKFYGAAMYRMRENDFLGIPHEAGVSPKATGVLVERDGEHRSLHADVVAVCAGVGRSAHLLLESRTTKHPYGIGNSSCRSGIVMWLLGGKDTPQD